MLHKVVKTIDFCYGHRLLNYEGKCRHLHGHNGLLEVAIESDSLDHRVWSWILMTCAEW